MRAGADGGGCFPTGRHYPGIAHLVKLAVRGLASEFDSETRVRDLPLVSIDTETTGRDSSVDRIVEIACVIWSQGEVQARHSWLINPERPIPMEAKAVHGIGDEDVRDKPVFAGVALEIARVLRGSLPLAYNADFDKGFLQAEFARAGVRIEELPPAMRHDVHWVDPLDWARELHKAEKSKSLGDVCERLGIDIGQAHRATDDAEAAAKVMGIFLGDSRVPQTYAAFIQRNPICISLPKQTSKTLWTI